MKDNNTKDDIPLAVQVAENPWVKGSFLGGGLRILLTPLFKWTNHAYKGEKMPRGGYFSGALSNAAAAVPMYASTFAVKRYLDNMPVEHSQRYELLSSFLAGMPAGFVRTPFDAMAQNKQLSGITSYQQMFQLMRTHHGSRSVFEAASCTMVREGLWSATYQGAIPQLSAMLQQWGVKKPYADLLAVLVAGGGYGMVSSPIDQVRYRKHAGLTTATPRKSYLTHAKDILNQNPNSSYLRKVGSIFKGCLPRSITTTVGAGLIFEGTECYNQAVDYFKP